MAQAAYSVDRSLTSQTPAPRSGPIDPILRKLFKYLSLGFTPDEILEASDRLRQSSRDDLFRLAGECHRHCGLRSDLTAQYHFADDAAAISLSSSQRSSLISNFSRLSSASSFMTYSQESLPTDGPYLNRKQPQGPQTTAQPHEIVSSPSVTTYNNLTCFACNKQCSSPSSLSRHQQEKCERKVDWICPVCQWTGERLIRHYATSHEDQCATYRSIHGERVCDDCRAYLSSSCQTLLPKQAWGCLIALPVSEILTIGTDTALFITNKETLGLGQR